MIPLTAETTYAQNPFITTWKTDNPGTSNDDQITIPTTGTGYNYDVNWEEVGNTGNNGSLTGVTGDTTITFPSAGTYRVEISGDFPRIYFNNSGDKEKILTVEQWGEIAWSSMNSAFHGCTTLTVPATDMPDLSAVTNLASMFEGATSFNGDIGSWNVSTVTNMRQMFSNASSFNQDIGGWDVSNVTDMSLMFLSATSFNGDVSSWDVSSVTNMAIMFNAAESFNQDISGWDVSSVTGMRYMFAVAKSFNQNISIWNTSNVLDMEGMFSSAVSFNQDISGWDVSSVMNMAHMFTSALSFNQDIGAWNVSSVTDMRAMFYNASFFDQNLGGWDISNVTDMTLLLSNSGLSTINYDSTLIGWPNLGTLQSNVELGASGLTYCEGADARQSLIDNHNWTITGDSEDCPAAFITTWQTDSTGTSEDNQITIPTTGDGYNYDIYWEEVGNTSNNGSLTELTGDTTITFPSAGTYRVEISGDFPRIYFNNSGDKEKILTVEQWGDIAWVSMHRAFQGCVNLTVSATDAPDLAGVTDMSWMFRGAKSLNDDIGSWDVSSITNMSFLFAGANSFNQDISSWDVSSVTDMSSMFAGDTSFNQNISSWSVGNVTNMRNMFVFAKSFNQYIGSWDVSNVTNMNSMFNNATSFNADISGWDVSSVTDMAYMFSNAKAFNQDIGSWNVSNVLDMSYMFSVTESFNQNIGNWDVSAVMDMSGMFTSAYSFNQDIGGWDVSNVTDMSSMFSFSELFNQDIGNWDVSSVMDMSHMFQQSTSFNQDISGWDVSSVANMRSMLSQAESFNQDIGNWNVANVTDMSYMFVSAFSFDQNIGSWDASSVTTMEHMLNASGLSTENYDSTLIGWAGLGTLQTEVPFGAQGLTYCNGAIARQTLTNDFSWTITGDNEDCSGPFAGGSGSIDNSWQISTPSELDLVRNYLDAHFIVINDIDLSAATGDSTGQFWNEGAGWEPIGNTDTSFTGSLSGDGFVITGLTINRPSETATGLFGRVGSGGAIDSLGLEAVDITGHNATGGLVGEHIGGTLTGSYVTGEITGSGLVGGLAGLNEGEITNSHASGSAEGVSSVGGLVGQNSGTISQSYATTNVIGISGETGSAFGGLIGYNQSGMVSNSYATGSVTGETGVGGFTGQNNAEILNSYSIGGVSSNFTAGGFAGSNLGTVTNSYWDIESSGQSSSSGGTGLTTAEMIQEGSFTEWDFASIWTITEGETYPWLQKNPQDPHPAPDLISPSFFAGGSGTEEDPWQISTPSELDSVRHFLDAYFIVINDIDLSTATGDSTGQFWNEGAGWEPIGDFESPFLGGVNGKKFNISGLTIDRQTENGVGLFGSIDNGAELISLNLEDIQVTGSSAVGGLVGGIDSSFVDSSSVSGHVTGLASTSGLFAGANNAGSLISNSSSSGTVSSNPDGYVTGGFVGINWGTILNSHAMVDVSGTRWTGGLAGENIKGEIFNSFATGTVTGGQYVGGLVGSNSDSSVISESYATGEVTGSDMQVGGLVGINQHESQITKSYASGIVIGTERVGGLVGHSTGGTIDSSYATGNVESSSFATGGLVGWSDNANQIIYSYATGSVKSESGHAGGLVGRHRGGSIISESHATGNVYGTGSEHHAFRGGLAGSNQASTITSSYATGNITGIQGIGGLVGINSTDGIVSNSFATGTVIGNNRTGGLVGENSHEVSNSFATGDVYAESGAVAGLVGYNYADGIMTNNFSIGPVAGDNAVGGLAGVNAGSITNNYSTGSVFGNETLGGLIGNDSDDTVTSSFWNVETSGLSSSAGGSGLTTSQMMQQASFSSWDFDTIWTINENESYPWLQESSRPEPAPFSLLAPEDGEEIDLPSVFSWEEFTGATSYRMQVFKSPFDTIEVDTSGIIGESIEFRGLEENTEYYWRIAAEDSLGPLAWSSEVWSFMVHMSTGIEQEDIPKEFTLSQNYPNPFNPSTIIRYGLPEAAEVRLVIYDLLGRQVAVPVNKHQKAGYHQINFEAGYLSSGIYIYRITTGDFVETRKMVLVK